MKVTRSQIRRLVIEACWDGYLPGAQSGVKTKIGKSGNRVPNCEEINEDDSDNVTDKNYDIILPRGKDIILKAEDEDYERGLVIKLRDSGGYDVYYWYDNPKKIYPAEIKIDGETITDSGRKIFIGYHPELKKEGLRRLIEASEISINEAEYQGKRVKLNKPRRIRKGEPGYGKSQMVVFVNSGKKDKDGNIKPKRVAFGDPKSRIKKSNPKRRKSFRARHNCDSPGEKTSARYWSCKAW